MHVLLVNNSPILVYGYGGTERVIWDLGKTLVRLGHRVSYLVPEGSACDFGQVLPIRPDAPWAGQIPADVDITHFQFNPRCELDTPYLVTEHGNARKPKPLPLNTVFLSRDHAARYGSTRFVYNGQDWSAYGAVDFERARAHHHFLGKAAWGVKNVKGAMRVARLAGVELDVLGGTRLNLRRGFRWTLSRRVHFFGMVGGAQKNALEKPQENTPSAEQAMVAFSTRAAICSATQQAPAAEIPAKMPSSRARRRHMSSASSWLTSTSSSTRWGS